MTAKNYAAVLFGPMDLRVVERPIPEIGDKDVLIKMDCVGICGSDVKMYHTGKCGLESLEEPIVMGHEGAGYVAKVGSKVENLKIGDRVAIEPTQPCRACEMCKRGRYNVCDSPGYCSTTGVDGNLCQYYKHVADFCHNHNCMSTRSSQAREMCKRGRYNLCDSPGYCSTTGVDGNLCQYYKHVADFCHNHNCMSTRSSQAREMCKRGRHNLCDSPGYCSTTGVDGNLCQYYKHDFYHKIPDNLSMEEGAAVQPLAIATHACNRAGIKLGTEMVIFGAGPIGVLCAMVARAMGATKILITDVVQSRLDTAKAVGVDLTLLIEKEHTEKQTADTIQQMMGCRPDVTMDACGFASAQRVAMMITRTGGVVTIVGIGGDTTELPLTGAVLREVDIRGSYRISNTYPAALAAVSRGLVDLKSFITHHFPLQRSQEAVEFAKTGEAMKIIIHVQE